MAFSQDFQDGMLHARRVLAEYRQYYKQLYEKCTKDEEKLAILDTLIIIGDCEQRINTEMITLLQGEITNG